jgi:hypothetical protein
MTRNQIRITLLSGFALVAALIASRPVAAFRCAYDARVL